MIILLINQENCLGSTIFWIIVNTHVHSIILCMTELLKKSRYIYVIALYAPLLFYRALCNLDYINHTQTTVTGYLLDHVECVFICLVPNIEKQAISKVMFSMLVTHMHDSKPYIYVHITEFPIVSMMLNNIIESSL